MRIPRIEIHDDVFDHKLHRGLNTFVGSVPYTEDWRTNSKIEQTILHAELGHGGKHNRDDIYKNVESELVLRAWDAVQATVIRGSQKLIRCYANKMIYGMDGYPHRDTDKDNKDNKDDLTCVCYFCGPDWKMEWCGETALVQSGEIIKSVIPKENRVFLFPSHMMHIARSVTKLCERPRIVLVFKSCPTTSAS